MWKHKSAKKSSTLKHKRTFIKRNNRWNKVKCNRPPLPPGTPRKPRWCCCCCCCCYGRNSQPGQEMFFSLHSRKTTILQLTCSAENWHNGLNIRTKPRPVYSFKPPFKYISVREAKLFAASENLSFSHCTPKSNPTVSSSQVSRKFTRRRSHVTGPSRCDWTDVLSATGLWCLHVLQDV